MKTHKKITRKKFFRILLGMMIIPAGVLWNAIVERGQKKKRKSQIRIPNDLSQGVTFYDSFIIVKEGTNLKVYSSRCTHLGCAIRSQENNELVCSCHGSRFSLTGEVINGPAQKPLEQLAYKIDNKAGEIIVATG